MTLDSLQIQKAVNAVDDEYLRSADQNQSNWLSYGRNYQENRYSELSQINKSNVGELKLEWSLDLGTTRGIETTPLVVGGIMYATGPWSTVYAINAATGEMIWEYDPKVPKEWGERACCDVVNRGVAIYKGQVFVGTLDGRLVALDASTGKVNWEMVTVDQSKPFTITGAPRIVKGKIIIGNGGAEYGVRGYVAAYNPKHGSEVWRFYTVPGNPEDPVEGEHIEKALETWNGEWWKYGGGGTVWDAMAFDPDLNLLYIGTGNGSPWDRNVRSPGGGDNLYLSSIIALDPDSGEMQWYYQTTPGDTWDYTATQHIILADLEINGTIRKVLMQAPKNGFFYVLDRTDGNLISAQPYAYTNWAKKIDINTGRPIETQYSRYSTVNKLIAPSPSGAHNWQPMAFNPITGLTYIPTRINSMVYSPEPNWTFDPDNRSWNTGTGFNPNFETIVDDSISSDSYGQLLAWDPIKQEEKWSVKHLSPWNAGVMSTEDLVFQGNGEGQFQAYDATDGAVLWSVDLKTGIIASPITYEVEGKQYITIAVGWGGVLGQWFKFTEQVNRGHIYTFSLEGSAEMPEFEKKPKPVLTQLLPDASSEEIASGAGIYAKYCFRCHGGGSIPDLKYSTEVVFNSYQQIVGEGIYLRKGMPAYNDRLTEQEIENVKNFILDQALQIRETGN